jgi:hypothetical protein
VLIKRKGKKMIPVTMNYMEKAILTLNPNFDGHPVKLDGVPIWVLDNGNATMGDISPAMDGLSCEVPSGDNAITGSGATVTVQADADLGEGVVTITETFIFTITDPMATSLGGTVSVVPK